MNHVAFFGDGEKTFALASEQILELERVTGASIGAIYTRCMTGQFYFAEIVEVIRLGLIGGGTSPKEAHALVEAYGKPTPIIEAYQLAADILAVRWNGASVDEPAQADEPAPAPLDDIQQAAATGDLAAALRADISAAYADVP